VGVIALTLDVSIVGGIHQQSLKLLIVPAKIGCDHLEILEGEFNFSDLLVVTNPAEHEM
jgi:hypothetical protein